MSDQIDPYEGHFEHCYIREGSLCSCGGPHEIVQGEVDGTVGAQSVPYGEPLHYGDKPLTDPLQASARIRREGNRPVDVEVMRFATAENQDPPSSSPHAPIDPEDPSWSLGDRAFAAFNDGSGGEYCLLTVLGWHGERGHIFKDSYSAYSFYREKPAAYSAEVHPLRGVTKACILLERSRTDLDRAVARAKRDGYTWTEIGTALEPPVSRQAAWERFKEVVDRV